MFCNSHTHLNSLWQNEIAIINSVEPSEWDEVANICNKNPNLYPAFGMHPWYIDTQNIIHMDNFLLSLSKFLQLPQASLGEVGLDKNSKTDLETQIKFLIPQLELAAKFKVTANVHCFGAFDKLLPIIKKIPNTYLLHGYSGNVEITKQLLNLDCYFSFGYIQANRISKIKNILKIIPDNRILAETDGNKNVSIQNVSQNLIDLKPDLTQLKLNKNFYNCFKIN